MTRERLLAGLPVRQRRVDAAGVATALLEGGSGPPLVLLHGGIESRGVDWAPVIARLDDERFARWLDELINLTCQARQTMVAHSLLGTLAARFAAHPDALARLVVYAVPGIGRYRMPLGLRIVAARFALRPNERNRARFERYALLDRERTRRRDPAWFGAYARSHASVPHVRRAMRALLEIGTIQVPDAELRRIGIPPTLLWRRYDRMTPPALARAASTRLGWPLRVVDESGPRAAPRAAQEAVG